MPEIAFAVINNLVTGRGCLRHFPFYQVKESCSTAAKNASFVISLHLFGTKEAFWGFLLFAVSFIIHVIYIKAGGWLQPRLPGPTGLQGETQRSPF